MRQRKFDFGFGKLHGVGSLQVFGGDRRCADDLDGTRAGTVSTGHFVVKLRDSPGQRNISELTVHVVRARARRVAKPDTVVVDNASIFFFDLDAIQDFTRCLLHLAELVHVIPELGLCNHRIRCEDDHSVRFGIGVVLGGGFSAHHLVLS